MGTSWSSPKSPVAEKSAQSSLSVYILECEGNHWYVGSTHQHPAEVRINDHYARKGAAWTTLHKLVRTQKIIKNCDSYEETYGYPWH